MTQRRKSVQRKSISGPNDTKNDQNFKEGDFVVAKVRGWPPWPARVESVDYVGGKPKYTVKFYATNETSSTLMEIKYFKDLSEKEKTVSRKNLQLAFKECQEDYDKTNSESPKISSVDDVNEEAQSASDEPSPAPIPSVQDSPERLAIDELAVEVDVRSRRKRVKLEAKVASDDDSLKLEIADPDKDTNNRTFTKGTKRKFPAADKISSKTLSSKKTSVTIKLERPSATKSLKPKDKLEVEAEAKDASDSKKQVEDKLVLEDSEDAPKPEINRSKKAKDANVIVVLPEATTPPSSTLTKSQDPPENTVQTPITPKRALNEDAIDQSSMKSAIAKLQSKVDQKMREKEAMKKEKKEEKEHSRKLDKIVGRLKILSSVSKKLSVASSFDRVVDNDWQIAMRRYHLDLPVLDKCIEYFITSHDSKVVNLNGCQVCQDILTQVIKNMKSAKKNRLVPERIKRGLKECIKLTKNHAMVKRFVNCELGVIRDAMIERKENNDAK